MKTLGKTAVAVVIPMMLGGFGAQAATPVVGTPFQVASLAAGPSIARSAGGDFVVAWASDSYESPYLPQVSVERYDASGTSLTGVLAVPPAGTANLTPFGNPTAVATDDAGDFVVAWVGPGASSDTYEVYAQPYSASGETQGSVIAVGSAANFSSQASVAMDATGDFVVAWNDFKQLCYVHYGEACYLGQESSTTSAQTFAAGGAPASKLLTVERTDYPFGLLDKNGAVGFGTYFGYLFAPPGLGMSATGDFTVAWRASKASESQDYFQRYQLSGKKVGFKTRLDSGATTFVEEPIVAMNAGGEFVASWGGQSISSGNETTCPMYFRKYDASGAAETAVVTGASTEFYVPPAISIDSDGDFVLLLSQGGGYNIGLSAQYYLPDGTANGSPVEIAAPTFNVSLVGAMDAGGDLAVVWRNLDSGDVLMGQLFTAP